MSRSRVRLHADVDKYTSLRVTELRVKLRDAETREKALQGVLQSYLQSPQGGS